MVNKIARVTIGGTTGKVTDMTTHILMLKMNSLITNNISKIQEVCKKYKVKELYAFGSITRNDFKKKSDVDLLLEFKKIPVLDYADYFFGLNQELEKILHRKVDLIVRSAIKNKYLIAELNETKQKIYEA